MSQTATRPGPVLYRHRVNTLAGVAALPAGQGLEFDLRSGDSDIVVVHDPFAPGPRMQDFLPLVGRRPCIANVKCEGIEDAVIAACEAAGLEDFFLLDITVPAAARLARRGETRFAVRWSEHEPAPAVLAWRGRARWVWVDCFSAWPADPAAWDEIAAAFRVCLVSPELQGHGTGVIAAWRRALGGRRYDAVCTKDPGAWSGPVE